MIDETVKLIARPNINCGVAVEMHSSLHTILFKLHIHINYSKIKVTPALPCLKLLTPLPALWSSQHTPSNFNPQPSAKTSTTVYAATLTASSSTSETKQTVVAPNPDSSVLMCGILTSPIPIPVHHQHPSMSPTFWQNSSTILTSNSMWAFFTTFSGAVTLATRVLTLLGSLPI